MLERFNLALEMDRKVIEMVRQVCKGGKAKAAQSPSLCVNLSPSSVLSPGFFQWLDELLAGDRKFAKRLLFEVPETCLATNRGVVQAFAQMLVGHGAGLSLDHFGLGVRAFSYLQSLPLICLKVDQSFLRELPSQAENQFFVRSLVQIARSCDIAIYAEGIETEEEWQSVIDLGLNGGQGYYLGEPSLHKF
jgi:EAL domain-containing protein (putative c-di-GMP-specific phosphodiesterase class I)